ncbi:MAG: cysteine desulfurase family protein [Fimbriimonadaceae bacterium]
MGDLETYFDNASTSPLDPRVLEAMLPFLREECGNAHSVHQPGLRARAAVERAREQVASLVGAEDPAEIVFTSGATESNNWVLRAFPESAVSAFEHASIRVPAARSGAEVIPHRGLAVEPEPDFRWTDGRPTRGLVSLMLVNNEIGTVWNPTAWRPFAERLHSDLTQAVGKIPVDVQELDLDFASFSAHKFHGPKGIGALYIRGMEPVPPLLGGGDQENGLRAGTLNVPAIVGMGEAARIAAEEQARDYEHAAKLRQITLGSIGDLADFRANGGPCVSPFILSLSFLGIEGETLVIELDHRGFSVSSGAACSAQKHEPSAVLAAIEPDDAWRRGTIRISFGRTNTPDAAERLGLNIRQAVQTLRKLKV